MLFGASYSAFRCHKRIQSAKRSSSDARQPIVWLRSFANEGVKTAPFRLPSQFRDFAGVSFEESLSAEFKSLGPFIAMGDPTDYLPTLGARKISSTDVEWQATVVELMKNARTVLVMEGDMPDLAWELGAARVNVPGDKFFLLTPLQKYREPQWEGFRSIFLGAGFENMPDDPGPGCVVQFDSSFRPVLVLAGAASPGEIGSTIVKQLSVQ